METQTSVSTVAGPGVRAGVHAMSRTAAGIALATIATAFAALTWNGGTHQPRPAPSTAATSAAAQAYAGFFERRWPRLVRLEVASDTACFAHPTLVHRRRRSAPADINQRLRVASCEAALRREDRAARGFLDDLSRYPVPSAFASATTRFASAVRENLRLNVQMAADLARGDVARYNDDVRTRMPPLICIGPINHLIGAHKPPLPQAVLTNC
jgi:hypothetical protein